MTRLSFLETTSPSTLLLLSSPKENSDESEINRSDIFDLTTNPFDNNPEKSTTTTALRNYEQIEQQQQQQQRRPIQLPTKSPEEDFASSEFSKQNEYEVSSATQNPYGASISAEFGMFFFIYSGF